MNLSFLSEPYGRKDFENFLSDFLPDDFIPVQEKVYAECKILDSVIKLGSSDSLKLDVFEIKTNKEGDPRVTLTREAVSVMNKYGQNSNAIIVFYSEKSQSWRLSLITTDYVEQDEKIKERYSNPRRFSFMLGSGCKKHTPESMLSKKIHSFEDLKERFNIEVVTKEFYNELFKWYEWALKHVTFPSGDTTKNKNGKFNFKQSTEKNELNLIRLITRLMFVWFIKQKDLIPSWIFDQDELKKVLVDFDAESTTHGNYYNAIIQNLFFATLNKKIEDRAFADDKSVKYNKQFGVKTFYRDNHEQTFFKETHKKIIERFESVPFLNGGLFECLDELKDNADKTKNIQVFIDGFSREPERMAFVPNHLFWLENEGTNEGLIHILNRYNFTVEENTPTDVQIALDPELLGKVFENLLGTYNPETKDTARKSSGSFYTPRTVVNFMIDEALKNYLLENVAEMNAKQIAKLFDDNEIIYDENNADKVVNAIKSITVLDPACGSGAFPMGMLQRMVHLIQKSTDFNGDDEAIYQLKLELIENCLYGVDIQPIAVQICKLRFFISLICEQTKTGSKEDNYGFNPLPNLETKFVAADSLIGLKKENGMELVKFDEIDTLKNELSEIRKKHFKTSTAREKAECRKKDKEKRQEIVTLLTKSLVEENSEKTKKLENELENERKDLIEKIKNLPVVMIDAQEEAELFDTAPKTLFQKDKNEDARKLLRKQLVKVEKDLTAEKTKKSMYGDYAKILEKLVSWNPYDQNAVSTFFDAQWMFNIKDGFDVVIGNPPYIQLQDNKGKLADLYQHLNYKSFKRTGDIYQLFYERGIGLLKEKGHLVFITSNKWMRAGYGESSRKFFAENTQPKLLINLAGEKVFEHATVDVNILVVQKAKYEHETVALKGDLDCLEKRSDFVRQNSSSCNFSTSDSWVILSPIEQSIKRKIESIGTPLKEWDIQINYGIKTGFNDAFIISTEKRNEILNNCTSEEERKKTDELIRPILRGRDIKRYGYNWADLWLINTHNGIKEKNIPRIDINFYPAVKKHLDDYFEKLLSRTDKGDTPYNLRNCAYMDDFFKPKIYWAELARTGNSFIFTEEKIMAIAGVFILTMSDVLEKQVGYKFLTMFLNCPIALFYFDMIYSKLDNTGWQWKKEPIEKLPIPLLNIDKQSKLLKLYDELLKENYNKDEIIAKISLEIFSIFDLTKEEINSVYERTIVFKNEFEIIKKIY